MQLRSGLRDFLLPTVRACDVSARRRESNPLCFLRLSFSDEQIRGDWLGKKKITGKRGEMGEQTCFPGPNRPTSVPVDVPPHSLISAFPSVRVLERRLTNREGGWRAGGCGDSTGSEKGHTFILFYLLGWFLDSCRLRRTVVIVQRRSIFSWFLCVCEKESFSVGYVFCGCCVCTAAVCKHSQTQQFQTSV